MSLRICYRYNRLTKCDGSFLSITIYETEVQTPYRPTNKHRFFLHRSFEICILWNLYYVKNPTGSDKFKLKKKMCRFILESMFDLFCLMWFWISKEIERARERERKRKKRTSFRFDENNDRMRYTSSLNYFSSDSRRQSTTKHYNKWLCLNALGTYSKHTNLIRYMEANNI